MTSPVRAVLQELPAGMSDFRLPVVSNDTIWKNHWDSWSDPGCQLSVPGGGAILSIGMPGSSSVSIQASSNVSFLLLFLKKLHSRPARVLEWHSEQQKASALPVWSSSGAKTLVKGVFLHLGAFALAPLALTGSWGLQSGQKAMLQPQSS